MSISFWRCRHWLLGLMCKGRRRLTIGRLNSAHVNGTYVRIVCALWTLSIHSFRLAVTSRHFYTMIWDDSYVLVPLITWCHAWTCMMQHNPSFRVQKTENSILVSMRVQRSMVLDSRRLISLTIRTYTDDDVHGVFKYHAAQ